MSATPPSMALAVPFAWTPDGTYDLRLAFASGASPVDVLVPAGTYRMNLATMGTDFLRVLPGEVTGDLMAAGRTETCALTLSAAGVVTLTLSAEATWTFSAALRDALGMGSTIYAKTTTVTGAHPVRDLFLFIGGQFGGWKRREPIAASKNQAGGAYGVRSGVVTWEGSVALELIPADPGTLTLTGETATPWEAGDSTLPWSCQRLLEEGLAKTCAFAERWQDVRGSTSESYDLVTVDPEALSAPDAEYQFPANMSWVRWTLPMVRTGTGTRA